MPEPESSPEVASPDQEVVETAALLASTLAYVDEIDQVLQGLRRALLAGTPRDANTVADKLSRYGSDVAVMVADAYRREQFECGRRAGMAQMHFGEIAGGPVPDAMKRTMEEAAASPAVMADWYSEVAALVKRRRDYAEVAARVRRRGE